MATSLARLAALAAAALIVASASPQIPAAHFKEAPDGKSFDVASADAIAATATDGFFTDVGADQDAVNAIQGAFFAGHLPTSTTVKVKRLATYPRLKLEIQAIAVAPE